MIIASTAHYAKFPEPVLESLHITPKESLQDQIKQMKEMKNAMPPMHPEIESAVFGVINHNNNINASVDTIKSDLENFLRTTKPHVSDAVSKL